MSLCVEDKLRGQEDGQDEELLFHFTGVVRVFAGALSLHAVETQALAIQDYRLCVVSKWHHLIPHHNALGPSTQWIPQLEPIHLANIPIRQQRLASVLSPRYGHN